MQPFRRAGLRRPLAALLVVATTLLGCAKSIPVYTLPVVHEDLDGKTVAVTVDDDEYYGRVVSSDPETLVLVSGGGRRMEIAWADIVRVEERRVHRGFTWPWIGAWTLLWITAIWIVFSPPLGGTHE